MVTPTVRSPRVRVAPAYETTKRVSRRPQHRFNIKTKPYQLQPFMIAPVLPGESLKSLMIQSQCWSDPLAAGVMRNIGWWKEYYFFYVKHRDLAGFETATDGLGKDLMDMIVSGESIAAHQDADGNVQTYCPPKGVDFVLEATKRIAEEYFRDEGEAWNVATVDGLPQVKIFGRGQSDWAEKLTLESAYEDRTVDVPETVGELNDAFTEWAALRDADLIDMDYEDWMRTYGAGAELPNVDRTEYHIPEDLFHHRAFQMPTNTVEPTTGIPATAVGWRVAARSPKMFFFKEPGWILGLTVARPKVYYRYQQGALAAMMQNRDAWLPAVLNHHLDLGHMLIAEDAGPLANGIGEETGYWVDLRDLLNYGDQFVNYAPSDAVPFVDLPGTDGSRRYASSGDIASFFAAPETGRFLEDGIVSLHIAGRQQNPNKNLVLGSMT